MSKRNIVHIEIPAGDPSTAGKFYEELFGWKITREESMDYVMWEPEQEPGGGFTALNPDIKPGDILLYVDSPDIEADLKKAKELGGEIVMGRSEIPGIGWYGIFKDPTGNRIGIYTRKEEK